MELKKTQPHPAELDVLRKEQDAIDREIVETIAKRLVIRKKISALRSGNDLPTIDLTRRAFVLKQAEQFATENNIPEAMAHEIFNVLIDWSHRLDREWRAEKK